MDSPLIIYYICVYVLVSMIQCCYNIIVYDDMGWSIRIFLFQLALLGIILIGMKILN